VVVKVDRHAKVAVSRSADDSTVLERADELRRVAVMQRNRDDRALIRLGQLYRRPTRVAEG
jgi:hypothetical protein